MAHSRILTVPNLRPIAAKIADVGPPGPWGPTIFFSDKIRDSKSRDTLMYATDSNFVI